MLEDWGPHTWNLFHTLAEKIKPEHFNTIKAELFNTIKKISLNLPCPHCSYHAKEHFKKYKNVTIANKNDLIMFLFKFHNDVNKQTKKQLFEEENLTIYSTYNTSQIVNMFINRYTISSNRSTLFYSSLQSKHITMEFINWINKNFYMFEK